MKSTTGRPRPSHGPIGPVRKVLTRERAGRFSYRLELECGHVVMVPATAAARLFSWRCCPSCPPAVR